MNTGCKRLFTPEIITYPTRSFSDFPLVNKRASITFKMSHSELKADIINEILRNPDIEVKSQQIDEPEMTLEQKRTFLESYIEEKKASVFLSRFGSFLKPEHLVYFQSRHNDDPDERYCIDYYIQQVQKNISPRPAIIRNRRFGALQKMLDTKNDHFSEQEMMKREPNLYEQLVGQYMTEQEKQMRDRCDNPTFLGALLKGIEMEHLREHTERAAITGPSSAEEEPSDADSSGDEEVASSSLWGEFDDAPQRPVVDRKRSPKKRASESERDEMKREFIEVMYQKFMNGQDKEFDYSAVDNNTEYDDLEMETQDEQDKYFDGTDEEEEDKDSSR